MTIIITIIIMLLLQIEAAAAAAASKENLKLCIKYKSRNLFSFCVQKKRFLFFFAVALLFKIIRSFASEKRREELSVYALKRKRKELIIMIMIIRQFALGEYIKVTATFMILSAHFLLLLLLLLFITTSFGHKVFWCYSTQKRSKKSKQK